MRLPAPLRLEAKQVDSAVAVEHLHRGGFPLNLFRSQQVPAPQRIPILGIRDQRLSLETGFRLERRTALEHHDAFLGHSPQRRMRHIRKLHPQQRTGAIELFILYSAQNVRHRQPQRIDGHQRRIVERDQRSSSAHELPQSVHASLSQSSRVFARDRSGRESLQDILGGRVRNHHRVQTVQQVPGLHIAVAQRDRREPVIFEDPPRPPLIDRRSPGPVQAHPRLLHRHRVRGRLGCRLKRDGSLRGHRSQPFPLDAGD